MIISAHLKFGDNSLEKYDEKDYMIVSYRTNIARKHNAFHPCTQPLCNSVEVSLIAPGKEDLELYEWYFNNEFRSGRIVFELTDFYISGESKSEHIFMFNDAQCFGIEESYDIGGCSLRLLNLKIGVNNFAVDDTAFCNNVNKK